MNRTLLINKTPVTVRAGLLEDGKLVELFFDHLPSRSLVGNIYRGRVRKILHGIDSAFVDIGLEKDGFLYLDETVSDPDTWDDSADFPRRAMVQGSALRVGQTVMVQVERDALAEKGPRVTRLITLAGRFLVHLPLRSIVGVSRKIDDEAERDRLRILGTQILNEAGGGFIIRTAAEGVDGETLLREGRELRAAWDEIAANEKQKPVPSILHRDPPLPLRIVRELSGEGLSAVIVDDEGLHKQIVEYLDRFPLASQPQCTLHRDSLPLFEAHNVEKQVKHAFFPKIWLKHGGYIVINQTEALVAVDVNSGKYLGKSTLEETAVATNLEAVGEIVRQIRLRNLGGILVLDFIDMENEENNKRLIEALEKEFRKDRANSRMLNVSSFGLVEMTRKRTMESVIDRLTTLCPYCRGVGRVKTDQTVCHDLYNEIMKQLDAFTTHITIHAHPDVVKTFQREWISPEEESHPPWSGVSWFPEEHFHIAEFRISTS